jgi:hypothetical protein
MLGGNIKQVDAAVAAVIAATTHARSVAFLLITTPIEAVSPVVVGGTIN